MPKIIIDTDVFSFIFRNDKKARFFLSYMDGVNIWLSFASVGEIYFGAYKANWGSRMMTNLQDELGKYTILPSNDAICVLYGKVKSECTSKGSPIEDPDYWTAACAIHYGCALATYNSRHFRHVKGLELISPD